MTTAGSYLFTNLGKDAPGMILQYRDVERGYTVWRDYQVDGDTQKSPVDIDALSAGSCWLNQN